jgi:hypothetical protein
MTTQAITSAKTSMNQLPAVLRLINKTTRFPAHFWSGIDTVLDYGGGKYDQLTDTLAKIGVRNLIYDPFNRSDEHNACVRDLVERVPADLGICSNVLNVIRKPAIRREILENMKKWVDPEGGRIYITVHEGDKSSKGRRTRCGWQSNRPARNYMREIRSVFPNSFGCRWSSSKALIIIENWPHKIHGWPHIEE